MRNLTIRNNRQSEELQRMFDEYQAQQAANTPQTVTRIPSPQQNQKQNQSPFNNLKKGFDLYKTLTKPTDITGTGPSTPGYSMGMDVSGETAMGMNTLPASAATPALETLSYEAGPGIGAMTAEAGLGASAGAELAGLGVGSGIGALGTASEATGMAGGLALSGEASAGAGAGAFGAATGGATAAGVEGGGAAAGSAMGGMSATGIGALIAAIIAAAYGVESSTGWHGYNELDRQWSQAGQDVSNGDIGSLAQSQFTNPIDYATKGGDVTAANLTGIDQDLMPATLLRNLFG